MLFTYRGLIASGEYSIFAISAGLISSEHLHMLCGVVAVPGFSETLAVQILMVSGRQRFPSTPIGKDRGCKAPEDIG